MNAAVVVHHGLVWKYRIASGWFFSLHVYPAQSVPEHEAGWL